MTIEELTARIRAFRDARDWRQFHSPKDMAVAIIAEAGELLQHSSGRRRSSPRCAQSRS